MARVPWRAPRSSHRVALKSLNSIHQDETTDQLACRRPEAAHHRDAVSTPTSASNAMPYDRFEERDVLSPSDDSPPVDMIEREDLDIDIPDNVTAKASKLLGLPARILQGPLRTSTHDCVALEEDPFGKIVSGLDPDARTLTPPDDSSVPLTASSGRVGSLLLRIHRNRSKAFIYGNLIVIGALSHQTWVSGEVLHFDVEIDNTSEKFVKKIGIEFLRTISACKNTMLTNKSSHGGIESTTKPLAMWLWRKGHDGWAGAAPQTQVLRTWNPIVPSGQATTSERGIEASYHLSITIPSLFGRSISARIPLKIIAPNSLGKLRLEQRLRHGFRTRTQSNNNLDSPARPSTKCTSSSKSESPNDVRTRASSPTKIKNSQENGQTRRVSIETDRHDLKELHRTGLGASRDLSSFLLTTNPIPRASDELLNEMLAKLQCESDKTKGKNARKKETRKQQHMQKLRESLQDSASQPLLDTSTRRLSVLRPLSKIGAHCRRKISDDVRVVSLKKHNLEVPSSPTNRASFDDYLRPRGRLMDDQKETSVVGDEVTLPIAPPPSLVEGVSVCDGGQTSDEEEESLPNRNLSGVDINDLENFRQKRQDFHNGRRTSANPFFKGSAGKERLRSVQHIGYRNVMERQEEKRKADEARAAQPYFLRRHRQNLDRHLDLASSSKSSLADEPCTPNGQENEVNLKHAHQGLFGPASFARNGLPNAWKYGRRRTLF